MTGKSGKRNKRKGRKTQKSWDAGLKATSRKQARYDKQQAHHAYTVVIPERISKNRRQKFKEHR